MSDEGWRFVCSCVRCVLLVRFTMFFFFFPFSLFELELIFAVSFGIRLGLCGVMGHGGVAWRSYPLSLPLIVHIEWWAILLSCWERFCWVVWSTLLVKLLAFVNVGLARLFLYGFNSTFPKSGRVSTARFPRAGGKVGTKCFSLVFVKVPRFVYSLCFDFNDARDNRIAHWVRVGRKVVYHDAEMTTSFLSNVVTQRSMASPGTNPWNIFWLPALPPFLNMSLHNSFKVSWPLTYMGT